MRRFVAAALATVLLLSSCGYSGRDGEVTGQAKRVVLRTNLICPDYYIFDLSLGVMRGGTGSIAEHDMWVQVNDPRLLPLLRAAVARAAIVKVTYDVRRLPFCTEDYILTGVEIVE